MNNGPRLYNSISPEERDARLRRKQEKRQKEVHQLRRNRLIAIFAIIFVFLGVQISIKIAQTQRINSDVQASKKILNKVKLEHKELKTRRDDLQDPDYVAKMVRYKFMYSKPNEKIYNVPEGQNSK
ncbi:septum formation initiator family protein [Lactobacillus sp. LL6]|uniref:FtsB family cell division protein n=1 Tax=Lactobacillus sp. LL6 TaxID=2596827 RepID=UPI0011850C3A|nr:septum formation initiator family protein [Lactobacillus sp. LL6]TSO25805.1 septum formation initiator family protein [Lactobacillus sp. LL6]